HDNARKSIARRHPTHERPGRRSREALSASGGVSAEQELTIVSNMCSSRESGLRSILNPARHVLVLLPDVDAFLAHHLRSGNRAFGSGLLEFGENHGVVEVAVFQRIAAGGCEKHSLNSRPFPGSIECAAGELEAAHFLARVADSLHLTVPSRVVLGHYAIGPFPDDVAVLVDNDRTKYSASLFDQ